MVESPADFECRFREPDVGQTGIFKKLTVTVRRTAHFFSMKWLTILFALFILLVVVFADTGHLGILGIANSIPYGDKAGHFILYGILTLLVDLTILQARGNSNRSRLVFRVGLILAVLIGLEEYSQKFFPSRTFSLVDLAASYFGVIFFSWIAFKFKK